VVGLNPLLIGVGDFVVEPDECASGCPSGEERRLPVKSTLELVVIGEFDDGQVGETESGRDQVVGVGHPGRCPYQLTPQRQQTVPVRGVEPVQQRLPDTSSTGPAALAGPAADSADRARNGISVPSTSRNTIGSRVWPAIIGRIYLQPLTKLT
jgi:hypothetical protein